MHVNQRESNEIKFNDNHFFYWLEKCRKGHMDDVKYTCISKIFISNLTSVLNAELDNITMVVSITSMNEWN